MTSISHTTTLPYEICPTGEKIGSESLQASFSKSQD
jgi:hypothetical protein